MNTILYQNGKRFSEKHYNLEFDFEKLVVNNALTLFGSKTIYVDAKRKIENETFGGVIPDGFLLDFTDSNNPEFYIVEVELAKHSFFSHIFPQITKFFAFYNNPTGQSKLIEKLYSIFENDIQLRESLKSFIGKSEIFKFFKDTIENSQNILLIIDDEKKELPEIIETYKETWGKMVKLVILKEFVSENESIFSLTPDFENIENFDLLVDLNEENKVSKSVFNEEFHLESVNNEILEIYKLLKEKLIQKIPEIQFNSQRHYISFRKKRNFAYLKVRRKKMGLIIMSNEENIREKIKSHKVITLNESVQKFYNGNSAYVEINNKNNLDEIVNLLVQIQK